MILKRLHIAMIFILLGSSAFAQFEFIMSDTVVTECKGILFDSGGDGFDYLHNSDLSFTICLDAPGTLTLSFDYFCVEVGFDSLTFHAGPDETFPQIGPAYSGNDPPPALSITSGCLTLHFVSDANVACTGWEASWTTEVVPPVPPQIDAIVPVPACSSETAIVNLSKPLHCDSVYAGAFTLEGPLEQGIQSANPVNCIGDSTTQISIQFAQGLNLGGLYNLQLTTNYLDACDSLWTFTTEDEINVIDCPIVVELITQQDTICSGSCTEIIAEVTGGDGNYTYQWVGIAASGPGPIQACLDANTTITLIVDDTSPAAQSSGSVAIEVIPPALLPPSIASLCQSEPAFILDASPDGGIWFGDGIIDEESGLFNADSAFSGQNILSYAYEVIPGVTCTTSTSIEVIPINAGFDQAACPGSDPFVLTGFSPAGGIWSGSNVSPQGLFDPSTEGEYSVTYSVNGCTEDLTVYVADIANIPVAMDTLCQSDSSLVFQLTPPGGRWYGEGIVDSLNGIFDPGETDAGLITLTYQLNGCIEPVEVYVKEIWAGWNRTACPSQDAFELENFSPAGGNWSGNGITDASAGIFDPTVNGGEGFNSDIIYSHPNGCTDTARVFVFYTNIGVDTLVFCAGDEGLQLDRDNMDTDPWRGDWLGPGVLDGDDPDLSRFSSALAGNGVHQLIFEQNTCADTSFFIVQQGFLEDIPTVCEAAPSEEIALPDYALGGVFDGPGMDDENLPIFNPSSAGEGTHAIIYETPYGCLDTLEANVEEFRDVEIDGPGGVICFVDTLYELAIHPSSATVTGIGFVEENYFNPYLSGEGEHWLYAEVGSGFCRSVDSVLIEVAPAVSYSLFVSKDTLCYGEFASILVNAFGGTGSLITYSWSNGLPPLQQHIVSPLQTTGYQLTVTDGCSIIRDTIPIVVQPRIDFEVFLSDPACYGEESFAEIGGNHGGDYQIYWRGETYGMQTPLPGQSSFSYTAQVIDTASGCILDTIIDLPGYPLVDAEFSVNPAVECIPARVLDINFIDLSTGGQIGEWSFGDGSTLPYEVGVNPINNYDVHGEYLVQLSISDTNGCDSKTERIICLQEPFEVFLPNAMTINNDNLNETFGASGNGILNLNLYIYDRRGVLIFKGEGLDDWWDGKYNGEFVPSGVFAYIVEVQWVDKQWFQKSGTITVLR